MNNRYTRELATEAIESGYADLVAFGRLFIANPDLVARFAEPDPQLNDLDQAKLFGGEAAGYTDYPTLAEHSTV